MYLYSITEVNDGCHFKCLYRETYFKANAKNIYLLVLKHFYKKLDNKKSLKVFTMDFKIHLSIYHYLIKIFNFQIVINMPEFRYFSQYDLLKIFRIRDGG